MPALNYQSQFAVPVESGRKRQTIRRVRKRPIKVGDILYFYTGMRTKHCRSLGKAVCKSVEPILIDECRIQLNGCDLDALQIATLARADGFNTTYPTELFRFFKKAYELPFYGVLLRW